MTKVQAVAGENRVYRILQRSGNIVIPADACRPMDGFVADTFTEYRNRSVTRDRLYRQTQTPSTLGLANSFSGKYYFAVAMLDAAGGEQPLEIWVGNRKLADVRAREDDNRVHLYVCHEQLKLRRGETFSLRTPANAATYRIESIALLKRLPKDVGKPPQHKPLKMPKAKPGAGVSARTIALSIKATPGIHAKSHPLCTGIPLPIGHLYDPDRVQLVDADKAAIPVQTRPTGFWPDGSVRWLLLDFQNRPEEQRVVLRYGRQVKRLSAGKGLATQTQRGVTIDTGAAKLSIPSAGLFLPGRVVLAGARSAITAPDHGPGIELRTADREVYVSRGRAESVEIEDNGPLRTCVRIECVHKDRKGGTLFRSTARIHAYAGKSWFKVAYTFTNDNTDLPFTDIRELTLRTRLSEPPQTRRSVLQDFDNHFTQSENGRIVREGRRFGGIVSAETSAGVCTVAVRNFWQNYPKALRVGPEGIEVGICPDVAGSSYKVGGYEEDRLYYYLADGAYKLKCGMSRTHELFYGFAPATERAELQREAKAFIAMPLVRAEPKVYHSSGVMSDSARKGASLADYEVWVDSALKKFLAYRRKTRAYGMMNYGDWFGERRYNWGNMEYDTPWVFLVEHLRGGCDEWFDLGAEAAKHLVDVDTCHASPGAGAVAGQYAHCMGHVGGYYPSGYREMATAVGGMSHTHTWVEGLFLYYGLTGDERAFENAKATCDRMAASVMPKTYDFTNCRDSGWLLVHLCAAYEATCDRRYVEAAHVVVERVLERQRESGGWERLMVPGHCYCDPPRHKGNASFMVGVLMAGLRRYHQITRDARVSKCIVGAAEYIIDANWISEGGFFRYTNCPYIWAGVAMNPQMIEGLGYAWRLSRSEKIGRVLITAVERCFSPKLRDAKRDGTLQVAVPHYPVRVFKVGDEGMGKSVSLWMRQAPCALCDYRTAKAELDST